MSQFEKGMSQTKQKHEEQGVADGEDRADGQSITAWGQVERDRVSAVRITSPVSATAIVVG